MISRNDVVAAARGYLGVPFRHQGRTRETGLDCIGLVVRVAHDLGISDADFLQYGRAPDGMQLTARLAAHMKRVRKRDLQPGDVVLLADGAWPCHVAILGDSYSPFSMIHSHVRARGVVETPYDAAWRERARAWFAFPGVGPWHG